MLHRNLGLKLAALGLAIFLWFWVLYTERNVWVFGSTRVAVTPADLADGLVLAAPLPLVEVRVKGHPSDLDSALHRVQASVSCKGLKPGDYLLPVSVVVPAQVAEERVSPDRIHVGLRPEEQMAVRALPVVVRSRGRLPPGFAIVAIEVDPAIVTVRGPDVKLQALTQVQTGELALDTVASQPTQELPLTVPSGLTLFGPRAVTVTVTLERKPPLARSP
jgi:hypothetical protein